MLIFNLTIHHLWGRVLAKFQESRAIAYADDGYIKAKLSVALQVLAELKAVFKEDAGLELNVAKTVILPAKGVTQQAAFDVAHSIIAASPALTHLQAEIALDSFCPEGFVGIGVPIGTDTFVRNFVAKTCRNIIDDVEKLDAIRMDLSIINCLDFARPHAYNMLILILCLITVAFCSNSM